MAVAHSLRALQCRGGRRLAAACHVGCCACGCESLAGCVCRGALRHPARSCQGWPHARSHRRLDPASKTFSRCGPPCSLVSCCTCARRGCTMRTMCKSCLRHFCVRLRDVTPFAAAILTRDHLPVALCRRQDERSQLGAVLGLCSLYRLQQDDERASIRMALGELACAHRTHMPCAHSVRWPAQRTCTTWLRCCADSVSRAWRVRWMRLR